MLWTGFSLRLSQYIGALSFSSMLASPSDLAAEKQPHSMRLRQHTLRLGWYSAGDEQNGFPSNIMFVIELHQTRESRFSQSEGPFGAFLLIPSMFSLRRGLHLTTPA